MTNITKFYPKNAAQNPDNVLVQAIGAYDKVLIVGYEKATGEIDMRASTNLTIEEGTYLATRAVNTFSTSLFEIDEEGYDYE